MSAITDTLASAYVTGTAFEADENGAVVAADTDELREFVDAHPITNGSWQVHDDEDERVEDKLTSEWENVMFLHYEDTSYILRDANFKKAQEAIIANPGVYAVETFLVGREGFLGTHLLRFVGTR